MFIYFNRINANSSFMSLFRIKAINKLSPMCLVTFHTTKNINDSSDEKNNTKKYEKEIQKSKSQLSKFSFIQMKKPLKVSQLTVENKESKKNDLENEKFLKKASKQKFEEKKNSLNNIKNDKKYEPLIKKDESSENTDRNYDIALKLAKLIDFENPVATAETLVESIKIISEKQSENSKEIRKKMPSHQNLKESRSENQIKELRNLFSVDYKKQQEDRSQRTIEKKILNQEENFQNVNVHSQQENRLQRKNENIYRYQENNIQRLRTYENKNFQQDDRPRKNLDTSNLFNRKHNLKSGQGLLLFDQKIRSMDKTNEQSPIWSMHYEEELKSIQEIPNINGFDEMITLTNEGKLWKFPIDNEQDIDETEAQIPFHEHVFLDNYLEIFPDIEPVREFMTLALNGLSQNSFLSLDEKKEIIEWYKKYFIDREDLIKEALQTEKEEEAYRRIDAQSKKTQINQYQK